MFFMFCSCFCKALGNKKGVGELKDCDVKVLESRGVNHCSDYGQIAPVATNARHRKHRNEKEMREGEMDIRNAAGFQF